MVRITIAALIALCALVPASADAHVTYIGKHVNEASVLCTTSFTPRQYRRYASRVYLRHRVSKEAHARLRRMHVCQPSFKHRVRVGRIHQDLIGARRFRQRTASYGIISAADQAWLARVRACESGGNYAINTGNGFYGAYQFTLSSWVAVGGSGYPHLASPAEQDHRALRLRAIQGTGAWPNCG